MPLEEERASDDFMLQLREYSASFRLSGRLRTTTRIREMASQRGFLAAAAGCIFCSVVRLVERRTERSVTPILLNALFKAPARFDERVERVD